LRGIYSRARRLALAWDRRAKNEDWRRICQDQAIYAAYKKLAELAWTQGGHDRLTTQGDGLDNFRVIISFQLCGLDQIAEAKSGFDAKVRDWFKAHEDVNTSGVSWSPLAGYLPIMEQFSRMTPVPPRASSLS
jgi:hypothetical protein